jgi:hypothetical protein
MVNPTGSPSPSLSIPEYHSTENAIYIRFSFWPFVIISSLMEATFVRATDPEANRRIQKARPHIGVEPQFFDKEINLMKSAFPILAAVALLLGASTAQAARPMGNSNIILAPTPPLQSSLPPMTNSGALNRPQNPAALGVPGQGSFGALPGNPGSATYDPNAALPTLGNSGSAISPDQGTSAGGINAPSTNVNGGR